MSDIYGVVSDQHFHNFSVFSQVNSEGVNDRLARQISELFRCADTVKSLGGRTIINAGDTFHVRGSVTPSVLNPVIDAHRALIEMGFEILILAGNHDAEHKHVSRLGNSVTALEAVGCIVINEPCSIGNKSFVPWYADVSELKSKIESLCDGAHAGRDLFIHAPVDGVIVGIPDHGLDPAYLAGLGFKRVMSGHFHNHKDFGNGVYSIGSTTHLTWSDVGSKAGFLIVDDNEVKWFKSHAPEFIDLTDDVEPDDVPLLVDGNFVRARVATSKTAEINKLREWLIDCGAKGVVIQTVKQSANTRSTAPTSISAGASLEVSIADYIKTQSFDHADDVQIEAQKILTELGE